MATPRVLAVDDNPRNLDIIRRSLGASVALSVAACGEDALGVAARVRPDIVLLDLMMPGIDGYETCRRLRARPETSHAKIIMVSARAGAGDRIVGYEAGADDFVAKPFDPDELLAKVRVYARLKSVEETDRAKSDLLTLLGHETRTPLTSVLTALALLAEDATLGDEQQGLVEVAAQGGQRLLNLIERALLVTQVRGGGVRFDLQPHDLGDLVGAALHAVQGRAAARQVALRAEVARGVTIRVDGQHVPDAIVALLDNAIRFSPPGGEVRVTALSRHDACTIEVADHGPGVPPDVVPQLFHSLVVGNLRHHTQGHGLSLAMVDGVVTRHGGSVSVDTAEGHGSTFRIHLPLDADPVAAGGP